MQTIGQLEQKKTGLVRRARALLDRAERERRDFSRREKNRWALHIVEIEAANQDLDILKSDGHREATQRRQRQRSLARVMTAIRRHPTEAMRTAYHEAGHATLSVLEGTGIQTVFLEVSRGGGVAGAFYPRRNISTEVLAAGLAGERVQFPNDKQGWDGLCKGDFRQLEAAYRKQCLNVKGYAWSDLERAENRLRESWPAVRALAERLLAKGAVRGREAERVVMDNLPASLRSQAALRTQNAENHERALAMLAKDRAA